MGEKRKEKMTDYIVRAAAAGAQIRAFACSTRNLVERARQIHNTSPVVTAALGRLLSAGAMMGSMLKGEKDLLTLQIRGDGPMGGLVVTADAGGHVKGYAYVPDVILPANSMGKLDVAGARNRRGPDLLFRRLRTGALLRGTGSAHGKGQYRKAGGGIPCPAHALCGGWSH